MQYSIPCPQKTLYFSSYSHTITSPPCTSTTNKSNENRGKKNLSLISLTASSNSMCTTSSSSSSSSTISSSSNPFIKHCVKLRQSSTYRHSHGSVVVVGLTPIREILSFEELQRGKIRTIDAFFLLDGVEVPEEIYDSSIRIVRVSTSVMKKLSGLQSINSIEAIALMRIPSSFCIIDDNQEDSDCQNWYPSPHRVLVLDRIQDPGNLGTLLRSAMAFKWDGVFLLPGCCDPFNEKALRAARGASFQLPIVCGNWVHLEVLSKNFGMKMLAGHPKNSEEENYTSTLSNKLADSLANNPLCLVLGSEGDGLSEESRKACELVSIPMVGKFESLNVSVAGGIFLFMLQDKNQRGD